MDREERVLILTPTRKDGEVTSSLLARAAMNGFVCRDLLQLAQEVRLGAGAILLTEEVIGAKGFNNCWKP